MDDHNIRALTELAQIEYLSVYTSQSCREFV